MPAAEWQVCGSLAFTGLRALATGRSLRPPPLPVPSAPPMAIRPAAPQAIILAGAIRGAGGWPKACAISMDICAASLGTSRVTSTERSRSSAANWQVSIPLMHSSAAKRRWVSPCEVRVH
eukprot:CAMPEP_0194601226 /NCGR_PEP_ID=MMETSP0292-20121207/28879_1 /TAXON_ID=39354 /ORGANISM="Heterosigma akashiwo, Strain CCMP2393" /LENGTH=119 /DNA_ID=CAMNT_0039463139 /DNA_START=402 /DNA_END=761 /DNA_ORIENTATION=-